MVLKHLWPQNPFILLKFRGPQRVLTWVISIDICSTDIKTKNFVLIINSLKIIKYMSYAKYIFQNKNFREELHCFTNLQISYNSG